MVKRRGGRRSNTTKSQPTTKTPSTKLDASDEPEALTSPSTGTTTESQQTVFIDPYSLSPSKLEGLVSEKALFVKVVDIQKTNAKLISGVDFSISPLKVENKSSSKIEALKTAENNDINIKLGDSMSINRNKTVNVVSRVVTRSRRLTGNKESADKLTTVGVIKTTRRSNKIGLKQKTTGTDNIDETSQLKGTENLKGNVDSSLKTESVSPMDDEDPCLSGDIMYEQIIEDVADDVINIDIDGSDAMLPSSESQQSRAEDTPAISSQNLKLDNENDSSKPSSTSDHATSNDNSKEIETVQVCDDSKVSSSSSINENIFCANEIAFKSEGDNVVSSESLPLNTDINVTVTECQNIRALSSLKLDPGVEPVSSSKTESHFEPIFSIDDNSSEQVPMEVVSLNSEARDQEAVEPLKENTDNTPVNEAKEEPYPKQANSPNSSDKVNVPVKYPVISYEKIVTRSRSGLTTAVKSPCVNSSSPGPNKGKVKKKTKAELKDIPVTKEINYVNFSSKISDSSKTEIEVELNESMSVDNVKDCNDTRSSSNDSDTPLVVNRCTNDTRKYMGPKGIIKNNYCNHVELNDSLIPEPPFKNEKENWSSSNSSSTDVEFNEKSDKASLSNVNDKTIPMSPKELFMKNYSSQLNLERNASAPVETVGGNSGEDVVIGSENSSSEAVSVKELIMKNYSTKVEPDNSASDADNDEALPNYLSEAPVKGLEIIEQTVRRSRRNSADKAKRFNSSLSASPKEKKESAGNKALISLDFGQGKQDESFRSIEKLTPGKIPKSKTIDKPKKDIITISSILNEKQKPMSPKELIKKSFIANESRSVDQPNANAVPEKNSFKVVSSQTCTDDNGNNVNKVKSLSNSSVVLSSTEEDTSLSDSKRTEFVIDKGKLDMKNENSVSNSSLMSFDSDKPVKVKSRWRRTSELEMVKMVIHSEPMDVDSSSRLSFSEDSKSEFEAKPFLTPEEEKLNDEAIVTQRMNSFIHIDSNVYLTERYISKETKRMVCDCTLTKEEIAKEENGCGEDCLNRLLLIECGSRCPLGKLCSNKCFVNHDYTKCKVVNMANKGMGVISTENIPSDRFIMEYVGEVLDPKEFRKRAKEYSKEKVSHFYFMSLKADTVIDATHKGNISRFINHSCDPNAETQKWTVNGELRIGFFSKRPIAIGEEITFDYQLERYGKEAQKCYCGSSNCRGWLGENPDDEESDEDSDEESEDSTDDEIADDIKVDKSKTESLEKAPAVVKIKKEKKKLPIRRKEIRDTTFNPDGDLEDEIDKLSITGVKNQKHTLDLSRLIVRAAEERSRTRLLDLIKSAATPCLRLFLDYHGLNLLWSWMVDPRSNAKLKSMIMETLFILPIQSKTMLKDSKVLSIIEKWACIGDSKSSGDNKERGSTEEENSNSPKEEGNERKIKDMDKENRIKDKNDDYNKADKMSGSDTTSDDMKMDNGIDFLNSRLELVNQASKLLEDWTNLKEEFRIPRKQRVEQMKEHERQADMEYSDPRENQSYNRRRFRDRKESRFEKVREGNSRFEPKKEDWSTWQNQMGKMSKAERRQLFAERVKREEREKREAEELWKNHQDQCKALGVNPSQTAMFHPQLNALAFFHKETNCWMPYQEGAESYGGGDGGVVVDHHQPPPHYQLDYQNQLPPGGPGYYQQNFQPVFGQFNQALLFQPPPPPPPQQFNVPQHPSQPLPPHFQPPLPQGQPLLPQGSFFPQGPPLIQPGPPLLPHHGPPIPQHGPPIQSPQGPQLPSPHGPPLPPQHCPPLPPQPGPPLPPQQGIPLPPPGHLNFHQGFQGSPFQGPLPPQQGLPPHSNSLPQSPSPHLSLQQQVHPVPQQGAPPLPQQTLSSVTPQQGVYPQEPCNSMEVQAYPAEQLQISSVPLKLPPKWKTAKDKEGRLYYYHVKKRVSQWIFPYAAAAAAFNSEPTSDSSSDDSSLSSSEEEDEEEEEEEEDSSDLEQENTAPTTIQTETEEVEPDVETASSKKRKSKKEDVDSPIQAKKPKESNLVSTIIIPREEAAEMIGITKKKIRDNKEKVKREKARAARKQRQAVLQASGIDYASVTASISSKCEADTSSGPKRKIKEIFMLKMANVVVASLNHYRKHDCKVGRITSTKDFKALAKKLTHFIMVKELRHCVNVEDLDCNDNVKHKARDFIRKYMSKFGSVYVNPKED